MKKPRFVIIFIFILTLLAILINVPKANFLGREFSHIKINTKIYKNDLEPKLGLDLAGGVQLTLSADMSGVELGDQPSALESAKNIVEQRINSLGVAEAT